MNPRHFEACDWPELKTAQPLLTCSSFRQTSEFILKVSQFSELNYVPNFHRSHPVYFMAGKKLCKEAHMKITVELKSSDKALHNSTPADLPSYKRAGVKKVDKQMHINNRGWEVYGFLLVPGSLALMILICLPTMLCSSCLFWSCKKRFKRYPKQRQSTHNEEDDLDTNEAGSAAACSLCQELANRFDGNHFHSTNNPEPTWSPMRVNCDLLVWRTEQPALSTNENTHNIDIDYRVFQSHCTEPICPASLYTFPQNHHMMEDSQFKPVRLQTHLDSIVPLYRTRSQQRTRVRL
ncbi:hypothetical protein CRM22_010314 [Opisthorchis felineus]|uniref:Uncharacterized protein n=1 Tax=Opisthorchis felineus TaxID=147828 RepID=A0A4S2L011_OPIFE|nr:hypothetical protein CRM22_010314 [Opisthorchis felineus]